MKFHEINFKTMENLRLETCYGEEYDIINGELISVDDNESITEQYTLQELLDLEFVLNQDYAYRPRYDEKYYFVDAGNNVSDELNYNTMFDCDAIESLNAFKTYSEADNVAALQLLFRKIRAFKKTFDNQENESDTYFHIVYNVDLGRFEIRATTSLSIITPMFKNYDIAKRCIREVIIPFNEDNDIEEILINELNGGR